MDETMSVNDFTASAEIPPDIPVGEIAHDLMISTYHQASDISPEDHDDWAQLPSVCITSAAIPTPSSEAHTIHDKYHIWGQVFVDCWSCTITDCLPVELRACTPYSLALLARLKDLAWASAGDMARAHTFLHQQWTLRQETEAEGFTAGDVIFSPGAASDCPDRAVVEEYIKESPRGVTLQDVNNTIAVIAKGAADSDAYSPPPPSVEAQLDEMDRAERQDSGVDDSMQVDTIGVATEAVESKATDGFRSRYLQPDTISAEDVDDWQRLPLSQRYTKVKPELRTARDGFNLASMFFDKFWQCSIAECLPSELRNITPYSLALVANLQKLARQTQGERDVGHRALLETWSMRQRVSGKSAVDIVHTPHAGKATSVKKMAERSIQERRRGLMLKDVKEAIAVIKLSRRVPSATNKGTEVTGAGPLTREERLKKRQAVKESDAYGSFIQDQDLADAGRMAQNGGKVLKRAKALMEDYVAKDPTLQHYLQVKEEEAYRRGVQDAIDGTIRAKPTAMGTADSPIDIDDEEPSSKLTLESMLHDSKNDAQLSHNLGSFVLKDRQNTRGHTSKAARRAERRKLESNALPSERLDAADLGQLPLPFFDARSMSM